MEELLTTSVTGRKHEQEKDRPLMVCVQRLFLASDSCHSLRLVVTEPLFGAPSFVGPLTLSAGAGVSAVLLRPMMLGMGSK